jgi:hypothetical protein
MLVLHLISLVASRRCLDRRCHIPRVLVIGGETSGVGRLGDLAVNNLLQGIDALAIGTEGVLETQLVRCSKCRVIMMVDSETKIDGGPVTTYHKMHSGEGKMLVWPYNTTIRYQGTGNMHLLGGMWCSAVRGVRRGRCGGTLDFF